MENSYNIVITTQANFELMLTHLKTLETRSNLGNGKSYRFTLLFFQICLGGILRKIHVCEGSIDDDEIMSHIYFAFRAQSYLSGISGVRIEARNMVFASIFLNISFALVSTPIS